MHPSQPGWTRIDQRLVSAPYTSGALTWQVVARLTGYSFTGGAATGGWAGALVQLQPTELLVRHDAEERSIPLTDPVPCTEKTLLRIALALGGGCALVMWLARRMTTRRP